MRMFAALRTVALVAASAAVTLGVYTAFRVTAVVVEAVPVAVPRLETVTTSVVARLPVERGASSAVKPAVQKARLGAPVAPAAVAPKPMVRRPAKPVVPRPNVHVASTAPKPEAVFVPALRDPAPPPLLRKPDLDDVQTPASDQEPVARAPVKEAAAVPRPDVPELP